MDWARWSGGPLGAAQSAAPFGPPVLPKSRFWRGQRYDGRGPGDGPGRVEWPCGASARLQTRAWRRWPTSTRF
eukprot:3473191-Prymnesium_polylepis.1